MASTETLIQAMNLIRANATPSYQERVPEATRTNFADVMNPILNFQPTTNEFLQSLINRIGMVLIRNRTANNPLQVLKQGNMPLGKDIEEIFTNPAVAQTYNQKSTDLLAQTPPDTKAIYHRLNRQDRYTVTYNQNQLAQAFVSYDTLNNFIDSVTNSLYSGNYIDEFILCKHLFAEAITQNKIIKQTISSITDEQTAKNFIATARLYHTNFAFPSSNYNAYSLSGGTGKPVITWTPPEDIRFILRSDIEAFVDVNVLASAFNMSKADFLGQTLIVDNFDSAENCVAIMCDKAYTQIYDNLFQTGEFFNPSNLSWNLYLHVWQTYSVSNFCNAVAFVVGE